MKKGQKRLVPQSRLHAFVVEQFGRGPHIGESLLDMAADALVQMGVERLPLTSARNFLEANRDAIYGVKVTPRAERAASVATATDAFLQTYEWRRLRMQALKKHGARCQCCGATPATGAVMNVDHIKPRRLFPDLALTLENLQVLCADCNHGKGNWDMTDWREEKATVP